MPVIEMEKHMDIAEYLKTRLEHTLRHTHEATKLIYLVDGGILAMIYFALGNQSHLGGLQKVIVVFLFVILSLVNVIHARFLLRQGQWYYIFDSNWVDFFGRERLEIPKSDSNHKTIAILQNLRSTDLYILLHWFIAAMAIIAAIVIAWLLPAGLPSACIE